MIEDGAFLGQRLHIGHERMIVSVHRHEQRLVLADQPDHRGCLGCGGSVQRIFRNPLAPHEADTKREVKKTLMRIAKLLRCTCVALAVMGYGSSNHAVLAQSTDGTFWNARGHNAQGLGLPTIQAPVEVKGYCRFLGYARDLSHHYGDLNTPLVIRADDEFNAPNLNVNVTLRPSERSFVALQLLTFDPFSGMGEDDRIFRLSRQGLVLSAGVKKSFGRFKLSYGGTQFVELGDFLMSSARQVQNSLFDRNAWTYVWPIGVQHDNYHNRSDYLREVDFGKRQFNGLRWSASGLPRQINLELVAGRTPFNISNVPDHMIAGRVNKKLRLHTFGLGGIRSRGLDAWTNGQRYGMSALSASYEGRLSVLNVSGELAWGRYEISSEGMDHGGLAFQMNVGLPKRWTGLPLNVEVFAVSPHFVNLHSALINTSVDGFSSETSSFNGATVQDGARPFGAVLTPMHLMANNRSTVRLTTHLTKGALRVNLGWLASQELENRSSEITFYHKVTGLYMSRADRFQQATGPRGEITTFFRGAYQRVGLLSQGISSSPKGYNAFRINAKLKASGQGQTAFLFYLGEFLSTQERLSLFPKMGQSALVRAHYHEFDAYLPSSESVSWVFYAGLERILGSEATLPTGFDNEGATLHLDGVGSAFGVGVDLSMTEASSIFVRGKRVMYHDRSFNMSRIQGWEATIELKIQF